MLPRWQIILFVIVLFFSLLLTKGASAPVKKAANAAAATSTALSLPSGSAYVSFRPAVLAESSAIVPKAPHRRWEIPDPKISAKIALVHSFDDGMPLYYSNTRELWPLASLTKLITSVAVIEDIGISEKIPITSEVVETEGEAGGLVSGESYSARDLLKIMLLSSSNDAAAAFTRYYSEDFISLLNQKAREIGMKNTEVYDASGLNDYNSGTAQDMLAIVEYILGNHPEILQWTQNRQIMVQPLNGTGAKEVYNINALVGNDDFLGGKTGTSARAGQNLAAVFRTNARRIAIILMGSQNRIKDAETILNWIDKAYRF